MSDNYKKVKNHKDIEEALLEFDGGDENQEVEATPVYRRPLVVGIGLAVVAVIVYLLFSSGAAE